MTMQFGGALLSRTPAAKLCGVSVSALRKWQRKGKISAIQNHRGWNLFSRDDLLAMAEQRGYTPSVSPSLARAAFKLFDEGKSWKDVVRQHNVLPQQALELWHFYQMDDRPTSPATVQALEEARAKEQEAVAHREEAARREQDEYDESVATWQREQRESMEKANRRLEEKRQTWRQEREKRSESPPAPPTPPAAPAVSSRQGASGASVHQAPPLSGASPSPSPLDRSFQNEGDPSMEAWLHQLCERWLGPIAPWPLGGHDPPEATKQGFPPETFAPSSYGSSSDVAAVLGMLEEYRRRG